jgi:hypothetical protein
MRFPILFHQLLEETLMSAVLRPAANNAALAADLISDNHVRIYVTRDIAYNFDKITKVTQSVLGKLGCDGCHSGRILDFKILEDFVVNTKTLEINEVNVERQF